MKETTNDIVSHFLRFFKPSPPTLSNQPLVVFHVFHPINTKTDGVFQGWRAPALHGHCID